MTKCSNCSKEAEEGKKKCTTCLVNRREEYRRKKETGLCASCPYSNPQPRKYGLLCQECYDKRVDYYCREKENLRERQKTARKANPERTAANIRRAKAKFKETKPIEFRLACIKANAKKRGLDFSITPADIHIPEYCPILKCKLTHKQGPCSWSVDRLDSNKGYVPGNVAVISLQANRLKNNLDIHQLEAILNYLLSHLPSPTPSM